MNHILLIEDEEAISAALRLRLERSGYRVDTALSGPAGFELALTGRYQLILLDLELPGKGGLDICRDLRQQGISTPILMLTAYGETSDRILGLKLGADDYLAKPFDPGELLARMEAILRRAAPAPAAVLVHGPLRVDLRAATVHWRGALLALSAREYQLLAYFAQHPARVVSREELLREVWGYDESAQTRTIDVHIGWLRQKLEDDPRNPALLLTRVGLGYYFAPPPDGPVKSA